MTAESVPTYLINKCTYQMSQRSCSIIVEIDLNKKQTTLNITSSTEYIEPSIKVTASIETGLRHKRHVSFWCANQQQACNDGHYLERVLQSININGSFTELEPLLSPTNQTIDNSSCLLFSNTTYILCPTECNDDSKACFIRSLTNTENSVEVCARCSPVNDYHLAHSMTFFTKNLSMPQSDIQVLLCAVPQCNSIDNLERIRQLVTIDFDATTFFDATTPTIVSPSTTTVPGGSTYWKNEVGISCILFMSSLVYYVMFS